MIFLSRPQVDRRQIRAVKRVLKSGQLVQGPEVEAFEHEICSELGVNYSVAVNSGTSALHLGLLAVGIGSGDEVIVPSFSFAATANAVVLSGAKVIFADICADDFGLNPAHVEALIGPRTKAVLAVHLYGHPARLEQLVEICRRHRLLLFEDCAQALGAKENGRPVGSFGEFGALSFYATKNVSCGEGGMITTNNPELARRARLLRNQGQAVRYRNEIVGFNNRLTDMQAALGREQLRHLGLWVKKRQLNARYFSESIRGIDLPSIRDGSHHSFNQYTIRVPSHKRQEFSEHLGNFGIQSSVYYPTPIHLLPSFREWIPQVVAESLPETIRAANEVLSLPVHPNLTKSQLRKIVKAANSFFENS